LQEESEVKSQKFKGNQGNLNWLNAGGYGGLRKDYRPQIKMEVNAVTSLRCFKCQGTGYIAKNVGLDLCVVHVARLGMRLGTIEQEAVREMGSRVS
jgi:hypothetical protein